jgi:hypothetical protein
MWQIKSTNIRPSSTRPHPFAACRSVVQILTSSIQVSFLRLALVSADLLRSDPPPAGAGGFLLYYLDIGIKFWNVRKCFSRIFLYTFYEDFSPISRYPDVMIFCFIDSMGTLATSYTLSYQILTRLDSHYITRQESGVLCGSIRALDRNLLILSPYERSR